MTTTQKISHKLSSAQTAALVAMPFSFSTWGGKPFGGLPKGVASQRTLQSLYAKGLANVSYNGLKQTWTVVSHVL